MKIKSLAITGSLASALLLGACGNMNDDKMTKMENTSKSMTSNQMMKSGKFMGDKEMVEGMATIKGDKLMLEAFKSSKGPDLHVYLTKDNDIKSGMKVDKVDYDKAEQTFNLKGIDVKEYNTVTIYCDKAHVIFGKAELK